MRKAIQLVQIDPEELVGLIQTSVKSLFNDFVKGLPTNNPEELLTPRQVCKLLQINISTLCRWANEGKVKPYGIANRRYYKRNELLECLIPLNSARVIKLNPHNPAA